MKAAFFCYSAMVILTVVGVLQLLARDYVGLLSLFGAAAGGFFGDREFEEIIDEATRRSLF